MAAMAPAEKADGVFEHEDHKAAFIFNPDDDGGRSSRPNKRRRVSKKPTKKDNVSDLENGGLFTPLLNGAERPECVALRQTLFEDSWRDIDGRIQKILRDSNSAILEQVTTFVTDSQSKTIDKIPSTFVITGPDIAAQELLFDQLADALQTATSGRFVRLRSSETASLKAALKRIIQVVTTKDDNEDDEDEDEGVRTQGGRKYLDYDLEALHAFLKTQHYDHVFVSFQDSEGFDSGLLSELVTLLRSWRPRIPFTLLFGIATSVELLQARLLKSACRQIYGAQFDGVQTEATLETIFKASIAASDIGLRMGPLVLRWMLDRQRDQVAGIQLFVSSLKYAYMCHFYANPLSILLSDQDNLQQEHLDAIRNTPSFRAHVEASVADGSMDSLNHAKSMIEDDSYLKQQIQASAKSRQAWINERLRSLLILETAGLKLGSFSRAYVDAMRQGILLGETSAFVEGVRRLSMDKLQDMLRRIIDLVANGDSSLNLTGLDTAQGKALQAGLEEQLEQLIGLRTRAEEAGLTVRSKYMGHGKVMRTTVIAQKVQLSQDSAALGDEDRQLTAIIDSVTSLLAEHRHDETVAGQDIPFSEGWVYDSRNPSRDVFVPRPRLIFERSLLRPHDYLVSGDEPAAIGAQAPQPATAILYQMYQEAGSLINVADLWSAFYTMTSGRGKKETGEDQEGSVAEDEEEDEEGERRALVIFYRALAELRNLGYIKASKKKTDHIAKVKWL